MVKAIIFDWGGVLIDFPIPKILEYSGKKLGVNPEDIGGISMEISRDWGKGEYLEEDLWKRVSTEFGSEMPTVKSLWRDAFAYAHTERPDVIKLIKDLKKKNYRIALLSDTEPPIPELFMDQHYSKLFNEVVFSCIEGVMKPNREVYEIVLDRLGLKPSECVFIDDMEKNIEGAEKVGMKGILYQSFAQVEKELDQLNVSVS